MRIKSIPSDQGHCSYFVVYFTSVGHSQPIFRSVFIVIKMNARPMRSLRSGIIAMRQSLQRRYLLLGT